MSSAFNTFEQRTHFHIVTMVLNAEIRSEIRMSGEKHDQATIAYKPCHSKTSKLHRSQMPMP